MIPVALYFAYVIRFGTLIPFTQVERGWMIFPTVIIAGIPLIYFLGLHRHKLLSYEIRAILTVQYCAIGLWFIAAVANNIFQFGVPRTVLVIFALLFFVGSVNSRAVALKILNLLHSYNGQRQKVAIYGAGSAGVQLINAMRQNRDVKIVAMFDQDPQIQGQVVAGLDVMGPEKIETYVKKHKISRLVLAMPSLKQSRRAKLQKTLSSLNCELQSVPSLDDLLLGRSTIDTLKPVSPDALLGRDKVDLNLPGVEEVYSGKTVMVTGAGGSIGSELCRQLLDCKPSRIVLFEHSEFALYAIEMELRKLGRDKDIAIIPILGSVTDPVRVAHVFETIPVEIVLHAAAYKHVPLVEANEVAGLSNNVVGTRTVIPLFEKQIKTGGPVTVTHSEVTRFFMTIPEASRLVLLAGSFSTGGDVFVLDMGKPIKIVDLARRMIEAHGLDVRDENNPNGDIEISVTGLRPGEKLYEELLIGDDMLSTPHQKILRANEDQLDPEAVGLLNKRVERVILNEDKDGARAILLDHVDGYLNGVSTAAE